MTIYATTARNALHKFFYQCSFLHPCMHVFTMVYLSMICMQKLVKCTFQREQSQTFFELNTETFPFDIYFPSTNTFKSYLNCLRFHVTETNEHRFIDCKNSTLLWYCLHTTLQKYFDLTLHSLRNRVAPCDYVPYNMFIFHNKTRELTRRVE